MSDQIKIFSESFIQKYRLYESQLESFQQILLPSSDGLSLSEFKSMLGDLPGNYYFRPSNFFKVPEFSDINSHKLFMQSVTEVFSSKIQELDIKIQKKLREKGISKVLHLRYGDLLNGSFKQYPDVNKYFPYCLAFKMLNQKKTSEKIIIISDTPELLYHLTEIDSSIITSEDLMDEENCKDEFGILVLDLLIMRNCACVLAPSLSAFSQLGAHLGGRELEIISVSKQVSNINDILDWIDSNKIYEKLPKHIAGPLFARDFAQLMNTHSRSIDLKTWRKFARKAALSDPQYVVGCAQMAVVYCFCDEYSNARKILNEIRPFAYQAMTTHEDPLTYLTIVEIFCLTLQFVQAMNKGVRSKARLVFNQMLSSIQTLKGLKTFQLPLSGLIESLDKSLMILLSELVKQESQNELEFRFNRLKQKPMLRRLFGEKIKSESLHSEEIFKCFFCTSIDGDFLTKLTNTLNGVAGRYESSNTK
jgi:hypothetical protein